MGYDLHITRKENWVDEDESYKDILLNDWLEYIHNDPELQISDAYQIENPQKPDESMPAPGFCDWLNHPLNESRWFDYYQGNIGTKNPDEHTIRKMLSIAKAFDATVQGDDGEIYSLSSSNKVVHHFADEGAPSKKPWWKFW